ncbi:type IV secretory pathway TrbL component [Streptomyces canus]|uniref:hypothetical protein n=1 Tax=Streptomyces canus TaxID=58343 RepID=UPI00278B4BA4|nr:hypothetical protein [Streptomyces canus]MDQ0595760.1 type IV secretory pathway TrbL component [Streptomyces canus]
MCETPAAFAISDTVSGSASRVSISAAAAATAGWAARVSRVVGGASCATRHSAAHTSAAARAAVFGQTASACLNCAVSNGSSGPASWITGTLLGVPDGLRRGWT